MPFHGKLVRNWCGVYLEVRAQHIRAIENFIYFHQKRRKQQPLFPAPFCILMVKARLLSQLYLYSYFSEGVSVMTDYKLEIKQIVDYPKCRIYRQFIHFHA